MTNKPILSVERELLEELRNVCGDPDLADKANAILYKPVFESQYEGMTQVQAQAVSDGVDEMLHGKPAAQHQGEPIYQVMYRGDGGGGWSDAEKDSYDAKVPHHKHWMTRIVYAEQPAPVAVVMPERKTKADYSGYIEQFQSEAAGLYNSALDDVDRLNGVKQ